MITPLQITLLLHSMGSLNKVRIHTNDNGNIVNNNAMCTSPAMYDISVDNSNDKDINNTALCSNDDNIDRALSIPNYDNTNGNDHKSKYHDDTNIQLSNKVLIDDDKIDIDVDIDIDQWLNGSDHQSMSRSSCNNAIGSSNQSRSIDDIDNVNVGTNWYIDFNNSTTDDYICHVIDNDAFHNDKKLYDNNDYGKDNIGSVCHDDNASSNVTIDNNHNNNNDHDDNDMSTADSINNNHIDGNDYNNSNNDIHDNNDDRSSNDTTTLVDPTILIDDNANGSDRQLNVTSTSQLMKMILSQSVSILMILLITDGIEFGILMSNKFTTMMTTTSINNNTTMMCDDNTNNIIDTHDNVVHDVTIDDYDMGTISINSYDIIIDGI